MLTWTCRATSPLVRPALERRGASSERAAQLATLATRPVNGPESGDGARFPTLDAGHGGIEVSIDVIELPGIVSAMGCNVRELTMRRGSLTERGERFCFTYLLRRRA